jgi:replicative DNA helicase
MKEQTLPNSIEAERALLGAMIAGGYFDQSVLLSSDDFFSQANRRIYRIMLELSDAGEPVDLVTLVDALRKQGELESVGGATYVSSLTDGVGWGGSLAQYEKLIAESAIRRRLMKGAQSLIEMACTEDFEQLKHQVDNLRGYLDRQLEGDRQYGSLSLIETEYRERVQRRDEFSLRFGIEGLDKRTDGFEFGEASACQKLSGGSGVSSH